MEEEQREKTHVRAIAVILVVIFLGGLFAGYYFWGYRGQRHQDYKEMLRQTISYISTLEEKNQELTAKVGSLENEVDSLKKQQSAPAETQVANLSEKLAVLEKENADLKASVSDKEGLVQENLQLRQKVQTLVEEMNASRPPASSGAQQNPGTSGY
ncbi:MAG TPA: hypothetical protein PLT09_03905 [Deltaproteobacteria bacterium]|nr:hypothetical protein [Deltaproteobacteria bacterium]HPR54817.1 hypothetical protein [Deltaproteobacteria bacterium]HXK46558.1 hypothetical protein [Deltaproteobacteria bacterium]